MGDEVAFMRHSQGFCQEYSAVDNDSIIKIPLELDNKTVAASYFDGLMAHTLCKRVYALRQGAVVLIHNATSQVGYLLAQYSKLCGAVVIGTIDDDAKKDFALSHGCHYTVNHKTSDWSKEVLQITKGHGVNVAYCFSNKDLTKQIISCVTKMGIVSCYGGIDNQLQISNPREIFDNSLYITFPSIFDYKKNKMELILSADDLFNHILSKNLKISIDSEWNFENLDQLHTKLKQNNYSGSTVVYCS